MKPLSFCEKTQRFVLWGLYDSQVSKELIASVTIFVDLRASPTRALSPLDRTKRRFSTMVSSAAAAAVSRRLSATIGWCLASPTQVKPQIVRQGRALCLQYIKTQIRRSTLCAKKVIELFKCNPVAH